MLLTAVEGLNGAYQAGSAAVMAWVRSLDLAGLAVLGGLDEFPHLTDRLFFDPG